MTRDERAALMTKPTDNPAAYEAYLKARTLLLGSAYDRANSEAVLDSLKSAVEAGPWFRRRLASIIHRELLALLVGL